MTTEKTHNNGIEVDDITHYIDKFLDYMNGCTRTVAQDWVKGLGLDKEDAARIWSGILDHKDVYFTKTDYPMFHSHVPEKGEEMEELDPNGIFQMAYTQLLVRIARGEIDATELAINELAQRGMDLNGQWVGFEDAKKNKLR